MGVMTHSKITHYMASELTREKLRHKLFEFSMDMYKMVDSCSACRHSRDMSKPKVQEARELSGEQIAVVLVV